MIRVAMDATTGPDPEAAVEAAARLSCGPDDVAVLLVAPVDRATAALDHLRYDPTRLELAAPAPGRSAALLAAKEADALVADEPCLREVARALGPLAPPALAAVRPGHPGPALLLDVGAGHPAGERELVAWARMGEACAAALSLASLPRVAFLPSDDPGPARAARRRLPDGRLRLVDDVRPTDLPTDRADVVVCDGAVGRLALEMLEHQAGAARARPWLRRSAPARGGGRLLLGAPAVLVGLEAPDAWGDAVRLAARAVRRDLPARLADALEDPP